MSLGAIELLVIALFLLGPLWFAVRLARRPDPRPASVVLLGVCGLMAAATVWFPLFYLIAAPAGGMLVARGRKRDGWIVIVVAVVALVFRVAWAIMS